MLRCGGDVKTCILHRFSTCLHKYCVLQRCPPTTMPLSLRHVKQYLLPSRNILLGAAEHAERYAAVPEAAVLGLDLAALSGVLCCLA